MHIRVFPSFWPLGTQARSLGAEQPSQASVLLWGGSSVFGVDAQEPRSCVLSSIYPRSDPLRNLQLDRHCACARLSSEQDEDCSSCSTSWPAQAVPWGFDLGCCEGCKRDSLGGILVCLSLMTAEVERFLGDFKYWNSSAEKSPRLWTPFLKLGVGGLVVSSSWSSLYNVESSLLPGAGLGKISTHSVGCPLVLFSMCFAWQKLFRFKRSHLIPCGS